jgi:hypothetical protein
MLCLLALSQITVNIGSEVKEGNLDLNSMVRRSIDAIARAVYKEAHTERRPRPFSLVLHQLLAYPATIPSDLSTLRLAPPVTIIMNSLTPPFRHSPLLVERHLRPNLLLP